MFEGEPTLDAGWRQRIGRFLDRTSAHPPADISSAIREELAIDLSSCYAGRQIPHPFGKASGQLSCTIGQVRDDIASGLAFIVLKTVIAEDQNAQRSMAAWAVDESRMKVEQREWGTRTGWTVTWKGRGWPGTLHAYTDFFRGALNSSTPSGPLIVPSAKFHLPARGEPFLEEEYRYTMSRLCAEWSTAGRQEAMPIEMDFSPTLAGDSRSREQDVVMRWLREVPHQISNGAPAPVRLGVKLMNTQWPVSVQVEMMEALAQVLQSSDFAVIGNRLFDPTTQYAYGGWELSDRNLAALALFRQRANATMSVSGTGNIVSGRMMLAYAAQGCENGQVHTFFQVPSRHYTASGGPRSARALHTLLLHPDDGLVPWLLCSEQRGDITRVGGELRFRDMIGRGRS